MPTHLKNIMNNMLRNGRILFLLLCALWVSADVALAIRVKDVAYLRGARYNQLIGYGLVVGLDGTGDSAGSLLARAPLRNALERMGISIESNDVVGQSIAGVLVTTSLPPFSKSGSRLDVTVDTLGDASSLRGGTLMYTLLYGPDQLVYATAQGALAAIPKGIERGAGGNNVDQKSNLVPTKSYVLGGALVENELDLKLNTRTRLYFNLQKSDFTTAFRLAEIINRELGDNTARAKDSGAVEVLVPKSYLGRSVELVARIENLEILPSNEAVVVIDQRTGSVVMGQHVRISPIAISYGTLSIDIGGTVDQQLGDDVFLFKGEVDLKEIVDGLNKIGASSYDLVEILKIIDAAGALYARLEFR